MYTYKIDSRSNGNIMSFKILKMLFPKSTVEALHATKHLNSIKLTQYTIQQLFMCYSMILFSSKRQPALLGIPDIELPCILKIMFEVVGGQ